MYALNTFHFALLVHVLQPPDLIMMQQFFTGMHDHGLWWWNDVLRLYYPMIVYTVSVLLIC